jgi:hypothetical protein
MTPDQLATYNSMLSCANGNTGTAHGITNTGISMMNTGAHAASGALGTMAHITERDKQYRFDYQRCHAAWTQCLTLSVDFGGHFS